MMRVLRVGVLLLLLAAAASAQMMGKQGGAGASGSGSGGPILTAGADGGPVLKYPVVHQHAMSGCFGYLYISRDSMKFESQPAVHSFNLRRSDLLVAQQWRLLGTALQEAEYKFRGGGTWHFFHVRESLVQNPNNRFGWGDVLDFQPLVDGAQRFDDVVASLKAQQKSNTPPSISMLEPADAAVEGRVITAAGGTLRLRGIATHESGITSVIVNGQPAMMRMLTPQTQEFVADNVPLGSGASAVIVLAVAADKSEAHKTFTVNRRGIRITEPAYTPYETSSASVTVRGVASGFADVQQVEVAGVRANLTRSGAGDVEFTAQVPLNVGDNSLQGYAIAANGMREPFALAVKRAAPAGPQPLTAKEVEKALEDGVPPTRVIALVNKYGVDFPLTDDVEQRLRRAGADNSLLLAIAKAKK